MKLKKQAIIHPILFAIYPILFLVSHNMGKISLSESIMPLVVVLLCTFLFLFLLRLILKDSKKAGIICSIFLILFFSYGRVYDVIGGWQIGSIVIGRHLILVTLWSILVVVASIYALRRQSDFYNSTRFLNIMSLILVILSLVPIVIYVAGTTAGQYKHTSVENKTGSQTANNLDASPDIYYIILDGYANSKTLEEIYNYDNSWFTESLAEKGFYIASDSRSNYATTFMSIASSLNMEYINYLSDRLGVESGDHSTPFQMIEDNKVWRFLESRGYKFIHIGSGWGPTNSNRYADLNIQADGLDRFSMLFLRLTMLRPFTRHTIANDLRDIHLSNFNKLADMPGIEGPKFVFAHMLVPHPPYVFGQNGEPITKIVRTSSNIFADAEWHEEKYLNQLIFVSKKVDWLAGEILSKSDKEPIIILQSDHGPALTAGWGKAVARMKDQNDEQLDLTTKRFFRERLRIFNACYLPHKGDRFLYESITPVNTFRIIFNNYFDANFDLLDDGTYFSTYDRPYKFYRVPDEVFFN